MAADSWSSNKMCIRSPAGKTAKLKPDDPAGAVTGERPSVVLIYVGKLPKISGHQVNRFARSRLTKQGRRAFGVLPPCLYPTTHASVEIVRVLGPGQKPMDDDSIALLTGGLRDALKPSYIVDDSPKWATFAYINEHGRRDVGPRIEVRITYEKGESHAEKR